MIRWLHGVLVQNQLTRRAQRRIIHRIKDLLGFSDPYYQLAQLYRAVKPAAVLDIGAHEGETVRKILDYNPSARIHAFEPTPKSAEALRSRVSALANVQVHQIALSDRTGTTRFFCNSGSQTNSLLDNASEVEEVAGDKQNHVAEIEVPTMTLDDWAAKYEPKGLLLVKADIQGAEKLLVAGGRKTFSERVAAFYSEVCLLPQYQNQTTFWELHQLLTTDFGLALVDIYPCGKDRQGRAAWTDALWVKPEFARACRIGSGA
jgi:FkbM family methyltransferase